MAISWNPIVGTMFQSHFFITSTIITRLSNECFVTHNINKPPDVAVNIQNAISGCGELPNKDKI